MEALTIDHLSFAYPGSDAKALDDLTLSVRAGEFLVLCGRSGCGKTTLLRLLKSCIWYHTLNSQRKITTRCNMVAIDAHQHASIALFC